MLPAIATRVLGVKPSCERDLGWLRLTAYQHTANRGQRQHPSPSLPKRVSGASAVVIGAAEGGVQPQDDLEPASDVEQQPDVLPKTPEPCDPGGRDAPHGQRLQLKLEPLDKPGGTLNDYALVGTPHFMSPELLSNHKYGYEADIWCVSFGVAD